MTSVERIVRDAEGLIHRDPPTCGQVQGAISRPDIGAIVEGDICNVCWPPKPLRDVAPDRSERA